MHSNIVEKSYLINQFKIEGRAQRFWGFNSFSPEACNVLKLVIQIIKIRVLCEMISMFDKWLHNE